MSKGSPRVPARTRASPVSKVTPPKETAIGRLKLVPATLTLSPETPLAELKPLIVGAIWNRPLLVAVATGLVTEIGPLPAPGGTLVTIVGWESRRYAAVVPLKATRVAPLK